MATAHFRPDYAVTEAGSDDVIDLIAEEAALQLRRGACLGSSTALRDRDVRRLVELARCEVQQTEELGSDVGGAEAMLLPQELGGFCVLVDPRPFGGWRATGSAREASCRRRLRFRVLHEVAHTLFYDLQPGRAPRRRVGVTEAEEVFCDRLAAALLLPPAVVRETSAVAEAAYQLSERFDVSIQLVARSFASYHPRVSSVSLVLTSDKRLRIQWSTDAPAAQAAVDEMTGRAAPREDVCWAVRGTQALRFELSIAAL